MGTLWSVSSSQLVEGHPAHSAAAEAHLLQPLTFKDALLHTWIAMSGYLLLLPSS